MKIAVIGGGAAGFFAAITAAEANPEAEVEIFEAGSKTLAKVAISGGGRCNVTHHCFDSKVFTAGYPRGSKELLGAFSRFQAKDTVAWFEARGVELKSESDGRMFPKTDSSATIIGCLEGAAENSGVRVSKKIRVIDVTLDSENQFQLLVQPRGGSESLVKANRVILASGGIQAGWDIAERLGHSIVPAVPSLFTFKCSDQRLNGLSGLSVQDASISLQIPEAPVFKERGPLLVTHWGFSGPAVLRLSAWAARPLFASSYTAELSINYCSLSFERFFELLCTTRSKQPKRQLSTFGSETIPKRLWQRLLEYCSVSLEVPWGDAGNETLRKIANEVTSGSYKLEGKGEFKEEFVTCGGVSLKEVDFRSMQSKIVPGLYFAGEVLDIDGITGGFNFQAAWTTGWIAGNHVSG